MKISEKPDKYGSFLAYRKRLDPTTRTKPDAYVEVRGAEFDAWVDKQVTRAGRDAVSVSRDDYPEELVYGIAWWPSGSTPLRGGAGTGAPGEASFVYLDVGAWIGSADGGWAPGGYQRDFGIICGPHILLCTFAGLPDAPEKDLSWTLAAWNTSDAAAQSIVSLLNALTESAPHGLGEARVARYLRAANNQLRPGKPKIHVIVGDMHIPVIDDDEAQEEPIADHGYVAKVEAYNRLVEKYGKGDPSQIVPEEVEKDPDFNVVTDKLKTVDKDTEIVDAVLGAGTGALLKRTVHDTVDALDAKFVDHRPLPVQPGLRVRRWGRIDLGPVRDLVQSLVPNVTDADKFKNMLPLIERLAKLAELTKHNALKAKDLLEDDGLKELLEPIIGDLKAWRSSQDVFGVQTNSMLASEAKAWRDFYRNRKVVQVEDKKTKVKGPVKVPAADIFEESGEDFRAFVHGLAKYEKARKADLCQLQFHQLGDMIDLWIGFSSHYGAAERPFLNVHTTEGAQDKEINGESFAKHWVKNCLNKTKQGVLVRDALQILDDLHTKGGSAEPSFLVGNHDNYLGTVSVDLSVPADPRKPPVRRAPALVIPQRDKVYDAEGLFMLHGHQWDSDNSNASEVLPFTRLLVGTNSTSGVVLTQAAFIRPRPMRQFSDAASGTMNTIQNPHANMGTIYNERLGQVAHAADWMLSSGKSYAYAMGHTHNPCLCRVVVRSSKA